MTDDDNDSLEPETGQLQAIESHPPAQNQIGETNKRGLSILQKVLRARLARKTEEESIKIVRRWPPHLQSSMKYSPKSMLPVVLSGVCNAVNITVISMSTINALAKLSSDILGAAENPFVVLNFGNAIKRGGGWLSGEEAQEESIFRHTTISACLSPELYPVEAGEVLYSPRVLLLTLERENGEILEIPRQDQIPFSVITAAATQFPPDSSQTLEQVRYIDAAEHSKMARTMQMILNVAMKHGHRRILLGAFGCGVFRHPPQATAELWRDTFSLPDFSQWPWEVVSFAIRNSEVDGEVRDNAKVYRNVLC